MFETEIKCVPMTVINTLPKNPGLVSLYQHVSNTEKYFPSPTKAAQDFQETHKSIKGKRKHLHIIEIMVTTRNFNLHGVSYVRGDVVRKNDYFTKN